MHNSGDTSLRSLSQCSFRYVIRRVGRSDGGLGARPPPKHWRINGASVHRKSAYFPAHHERNLLFSARLDWVVMFAETSNGWSPWPRSRRGKIFTAQDNKLDLDLVFCGDTKLPFSKFKGLLQMWESHDSGDSNDSS